VSLIEKLKQRAKTLNRDTLAVWYASRDARTPWYARALAVLVAAYALSPIDLIPDFIPMLGYLDDLILIPAGIALVIHWIPAEVMSEARIKAELQSAKPVTWWMVVLIVCVWLAIAFLLVRAVFRLPLKNK
jgi:uncharacterized membrane protein YkvA (DUF1232 family)